MIFGIESEIAPKKNSIMKTKIKSDGDVAEDVHTT